MHLPKIEVRDAHYDFIATFLILFQPYLQFIYTNSLVFEKFNILVFAGYVAAALAITLLINRYPNRVLRTIILAALIILYLDFSARIFFLEWYFTASIVAACFIGCWLLFRHAGKILTAAFGVIFAVGFFEPVFPLVEEYPTAKASNNDTELPVYVHLILDEHIGLEGLDESIDKQRSLKQELKDSYVGNRFRVFGRAYSEYISSLDSISATLNNYSGPNPIQYYRRNASGRLVYKGVENRYVRDLSGIGYDIRIYQSSFFDLCAPLADIIKRCLTYDTHIAPGQALGQLETREKHDLVLTLFWNDSYLKGTLHRSYVILEIIFAEFGINLPHWPPAPIRSSGPISSLFAFDQLISDVARAPNGTMFLAHLLTPHHSYALDDGCNIRRPLFYWEDAWTKGSEHNSVSTRLDLQSHYVDQVRCTQRKIEELIEALRLAGKFENSVIVIHGDHGSRIFRTMPAIEYRDSLVESDFIDGYSTLFAIKAPHISPGYDLRMLPLWRLLQAARDGDTIGPETTGDHYVYLHDEETHQKFIKVPMPALPGGPDTPQSSLD